MKNIYKYLKYIMVIIILIVALISIITYRYELNDKMSLLKETNYFKVEEGAVIKNKEKITVSKIDTTNLQKPLDKMYKAENEEADLFSLSYGNEDLKVGDALKQIDDSFASDALYMIFRKSYPTVTLEEMGVSSPEEAYQVKQLAIWEVAWRTGEAKYGSELSYVDSVRNDLNLKDDTIFKKAKDFVDYIEDFDAEENETVNVIPTLVIKNGNVNSTYKEGGYIIGPYSYQIEAGELIECNISVIDDEGKPIEAKLVKRNGMEQLGVNPGEDFYIKTNEDEKNINIKIEVDVKRMTPTIYEAENGDDYIINTYIPDHIEDTLEIEWVD